MSDYFSCDLLVWCHLGLAMKCKVQTVIEMEHLMVSIHDSTNVFVTLVVLFENSMLRNKH